MQEICLRKGSIIELGVEGAYMLAVNAASRIVLLHCVLPSFDGKDQVFRTFKVQNLP